ncbi:hypothetical protein TNCV_458281 [Trichonephila clavipes]|nr:hypothetical protein TNCV_458281 [Trichonephila clavipes]
MHSFTRGKIICKLKEEHRLTTAAEEFLIVVSTAWKPIQKTNIGIRMGSGCRTIEDPTEVAWDALDRRLGTRMYPQITLYLYSSFLVGNRLLATLRYHF